MKKIELEAKSFFNRVLLHSYKRLRVHNSMVLRNVVVWFDTWRWFLTILLLYAFFGYVLPLPIIYLAMYFGPFIAYCWIVLWITVSTFLAYRETVRRARAMRYVKYYNNPNALNEYLEMIKSKE